METQREKLASGIVESFTDDLLVLSIPHTEYRIHLKPTVPAAEIRVAPGQRLRGVIQARALRIHPAGGGGQFIEPVWGEPRIVAGKVLSIDAADRRVLVDAGVPLWVSAPAEQDFSVIREGELVNFYVQSGTTFRPVVKAPP